MKTKLSLLLISVLLGAGCGGSTSTGKNISIPLSSPDALAYVRLPQSLLSPEFVTFTKFNRDHIRNPEFAFGYLERARLTQLPESTQAKITEVDAEAIALGLIDPATLEQETTLQPRADAATGYHNYAAMTAELQRLASEHPDIMQLESLGRSVQGRELWLVKVSDQVAKDEAEPKLLYIANMHGDEVVGRELMLNLLNLLATEYSQSARIKHLVDHAQIYIMPSMNPDGFEAKRRYNARGVDLNRDFPDFTSDPWDTPSGRAPETQALMALHSRHQFTLSANFHGGEVCFNLPWDTQANAPRQERFGDDPLMRDLARQYADLNPTMRNNSGGSFDRGVTYGYEWYEVDGGMQDWSNHYRHSTHATVELSMVKWPQAERLPEFWEENREALLQYLERGIFGVHLEVVDEANQAVATPIVSVSSTSRQLPVVQHKLTRPTLSGTQEVNISAKGYQTQKVRLTPLSFHGEHTQVRLLKAKNP